MSEKEEKSTAMKKPDSKPDAKAEAKHEAKPKADMATDSRPKKTDPKQDTAPATSIKPRHRRSGLLGGRSKPAAYPVDILARRTDTDPVVLGALKAAYGWTDRTTLTQTEFISLRDAWLKRPVKEG